MFDFAAFGQYIPRNSLIHRLDPRVKFLSLLLYLLAVIVCRHEFSIFILTLLAVIHFVLSKISFREGLASLKPLLPLLILAFLLNLFIPHEGEQLIFQWSFLKFSQDSFARGVLMTLRIAALVFLSNLFLTISTTANDLSEGVTKLFSPLQKIGLPIQEVGMMLAIALRFIPNLLAETDALMKAQSSRGANYDSGGFFKRLKGFATVLVPLFISSFRKAETLAEAMEARAYRSDIKRGKLHPLALEVRDYLYFSLFFLCVILLFVLDRKLR